MIFFRWSKLAKSLLETPWNENRVVSKSTRAARPIRDLSLNGPFKDSENLAFARQRQHATKSSTTRVVLSASSSKLLQQSVDLFSVRRVRAGITRRVYSGRAAQSV